MFFRHVVDAYTIGHTATVTIQFFYLYFLLSLLINSITHKSMHKLLFRIVYNTNKISSYFILIVFKYYVLCQH